MSEDYEKALRRWGARKLAAEYASELYMPKEDAVRVDFTMETEYETEGSYTRGYIGITDGEMAMEIAAEGFDLATVLREILDPLSWPDARIDTALKLAEKERAKGGPDKNPGPCVVCGENRWSSNLVGDETCLNCGHKKHIPGVYA